MRDSLEPSLLEPLRKHPKVHPELGDEWTVVLREVHGGWAKRITLLLADRGDPIAVRGIERDLRGELVLHRGAVEEREPRASRVPLHDGEQIVAKARTAGAHAAQRELVPGSESGPVRAAAADVDVRPNPGD